LFGIHRIWLLRQQSLYISSVHLLSLRGPNVLFLAQIGKNGDGYAQFGMESEK